MFKAVSLCRLPQSTLLMLALHDLLLAVQRSACMLQSSVISIHAVPFFLDLGVVLSMMSFSKQRSPFLVMCISKIFSFRVSDCSRSDLLRGLAFCRTNSLIHWVLRRGAMLARYLPLSCVRPSVCLSVCHKSVLY